jgi:pimeloyl-ACP methyl ester carboxylesterase
MKLKCRGVELEVEVEGDESHPAILLIAGVGQQLIDWPRPLIDELLQLGLRVIRFDNRDIGMSQSFKHLGVPNIPIQYLKSRFGFKISTPYTIADLSNDAMGILESLKISQAHIVGWSMGGMVAQRFALNHAKACLSMTCIMTASGIPSTRADVVHMMRSRPADRSVDAKVDYFFRVYQKLMSPAYPEPENEMRARIKKSIERAQLAGSSESGSLRQMIAIMADGKRSKEITRIQVPTLVIHGSADPMVAIKGGEDLAQKINTSKFVRYEGMGHDFPNELIPKMAQEIGTLINVGS